MRWYSGRAGRRPTVAIATTIGFGAFVAAVTLVKARRHEAQSPHFRALSYRDRRRVLSAIYHGASEIPPGLDSAVAEQARQVLRDASGARGNFILLVAVSVLGIAAAVVSIAEGHGEQGALRIAWWLLFCAGLVYLWRTEPSRIKRARSALTAAHGVGGAQ